MASRDSPPGAGDLHRGLNDRQASPARLLTLRGGSAPRVPRAFPWTRVRYTSCSTSPCLARRKRRPPGASWTPRSRRPGSPATCALSPCSCAPARCWFVCACGAPQGNQGRSGRRPRPSREAYAREPTSRPPRRWRPCGPSHGGGVRLAEDALQPLAGRLPVAPRGRQGVHVALEARSVVSLRPRSTLRNPSQLAWVSVSIAATSST